MRLFSRIIFVLLTGYILAFYSEWSFWAGRPAAENFFLEAIPTWIGYSCLAYFFLVTVVYFRVKSLWAMLLAGAVYGWLGEGVLVQTMYDLFPLHISWTGLAWHSLISVLFGVYYLPQKLREGRALVPCLLAGFALGFWSIGWWLEPELAIAPIENVFFYNGFFGLILLPMYWLWLRFDITEFQPNRWGFALMLLLALLYYALAVMIQPLALIVLPICLGLAFFGLWQNRQQVTPHEKSQQPVSLKALMPLLLIPFLGSGVYSLALIAGLSLPSLMIVFIIMTPLGFIGFVMALWKLSFGAKTRKREANSSNF